MNQIERHTSNGQDRQDLYRQVRGEVVSRQYGAVESRQALAAHTRMTAGAVVANIAMESIMAMETKIDTQTTPGSGVELACRRIAAIYGLSAEELLLRYMTG